MVALEPPARDALHRADPAIAPRSAAPIEAARRILQAADDDETEQALDDMREGHKKALADHGSLRGAIDLRSQAGTRFQDIALKSADRREPLSRIRADLGTVASGLYTLLGWVLVVALVAVLIVSGIGVAIAIALLFADVSDPQPRTHRRC